MKTQISLKWMLIILGVVGTVIGLLGRLWIRNPETFFWVFQYSLVISYLVLTLIAGYFQRKRAAQKQKPANVWLQPAIAVGCLLPMLLSSCLIPDVNRTLPTKHLVKKKLFVHRDDGSLNSRWAVWQELERRFFDDRLSKADAQLIFVEFEKALKKQTNRPKLQSVTTSQLLRRMASRGMVSDEQLVSLGEAYYGKPTSPSLRLRTTENRIRLRLNQFGRSWGRSHPTTLIWCATRVKVDGEDIQFKNGQGSRAATINQQFEAGQHEIRIELDCALVMYDALTNATGREVSQSYPNTQWPEKLLKRWSEEIVIPATAYDTEAEIISLTSDTDLNPKPFISFEIEALNTGRPKSSWILQAKIDKDLPVALSGDLFVKIDDNEFRGEMSLTAEAKPRARPIWATAQQWKLDPATVKSKTATIEFTPNRKLLELETTTTEIWGRRIIFKDVPIKIRK